MFETSLPWRDGSDLAHLAFKQQAIPGILGGLGPLAHTALERLLIEQNAQRGACCDQDHPLWILVNATHIPDRSLSLRPGTESCVPGLVKYGKFLGSAGADFLVVPCNTAHAFYRQVQPHLPIPWIHMIDCVVDFLTQTYPPSTRVGILATDGTIQSALYHQGLAKAGFVPISPTLGSKTQHRVMDIIYHPSWGIKTTGRNLSPEALQHLQLTLQWMESQQVDIVITGCTELSVGFERLNGVPLPWIDPLEIIASVTLDLSFGYQQLPAMHSVAV